MMAGSIAEETIRFELETWLHREMPQARVIHELVVGGCRADVAAIEPSRISLFEIKSERDTLDRLRLQVEQFSRASHWCVIVASRRWFDETPYLNGMPRLAWMHDSPSHGDVFCHPDPGKKHALSSWRVPTWNIPRWHRPHTMYMLEILWRDELAAEAKRHMVPFSSRATKTAIMNAMWDRMTGNEITGAVCRQLRAREFPRADRPIALQSVA
jgi:hypothetical protein